MTTSSSSWLADHAESLDADNADASRVLPALAVAGRFRIGVPATQGGDGGDARDAIAAIAAVAEESLTAAFVFWGQRTFIEYLLQSPNAALRERLLPALLAGERAGATGLSNAMKFLSGIEQLQVDAAVKGDGWRLDGKLAWVTNLRPQGFVVAAAVSHGPGAAPSIMALDSGAAGVRRNADLDLIALRGSNTASLAFERVAAGAGDVISADALTWLPRVRPAFLGMQCGLSIGLARASLRHAAQWSSRPQQAGSIAALREELDARAAALLDGVHDGRFVVAAPELFRLRIALADLVQQALSLELQAKGGRAYLTGAQDGFARRWRESAFIPVITPSVAQLQAALAPAHAPASVPPGVAPLQAAPAPRTV
jgi:alkylation response protein AidB-like acyl-CoA dehydrogenase